MPYTKKGALPAVFNTRDETLHKQLKNPIAPIFSLSNTVTFEVFVDEVLRVFFLELNKRYVEPHKTVDLGDWLQYFAFDVMGTLTFSKRYGFLEKGRDVNGMLGTIWEFMVKAAPVSFWTPPAVSRDGGSWGTADSLLSKFTQIPWFDDWWNKNSWIAMCRRPSGMTILKIVADCCSERQQKVKNNSNADAAIDVNTKDMLSRFMEVQSANSSVPTW